MSIQKHVSTEFEVRAAVTFVSEESRPENSYFLFSYRISIKNRGSEAAQLISRHWVITDADNQVEEVRGAGVVGLQPRILPGQTFEYESACPLGTPAGSMKGSYQMQSESGESFHIEIPEFYLVAPNALH